MIDPRDAVPLIGYSDKLSLRGGETIAFKVSSTSSAPFTARLMRSISADPNPEGAGIIEEPFEEVFPTQRFPSRYQAFSPGSCAMTTERLQHAFDDGFLISANVFVAAGKTTLQSILSIGDTSLVIDRAGAAALILPHQALSTGVGLEQRRWYRVEAGFDAQKQELFVRQTPLKSVARTAVRAAQCSRRWCGDVAFGERVIVAARMVNGRMTDYFNGKIELPMIHESPLRDEQKCVACWDFSLDISSTTVRETRAGLDARLINFPARAMTGSNWDAGEMCWRHAPAHYGAIHFHEDDIYDFEWQDDFSFTPPKGFPSGVYVMRIQCGEHEDAMPFYVCGPRRRPAAKLCILIPTFTYVAYGNHARPDYDPCWKARVKDWNAYPYNPVEYRNYGLSTYNVHTDGSGICHASHRRPLFNMRPGYITFGNGECSGLRHFQADSHLISWLHAKGMDYDIITDRELHDEGLAAIEGYQAVMTTTHPEYHTLQTMDALQDYRDTGGNLIYLGGNGFYWKVAIHRETEGLIEIRRAEAGIRAWAAESGEYYNAFDGTYGGLWRRSGRPPQLLVGIGFSAQGKFDGSFYRRVCHDSAYDWVFKGIKGDVIGDFGFSGGGAAGFELDRVDYALGTPPDAVVLATSAGHGDHFMLVPEEQLTHLTTLPGEPTENLLRADMVYFEVAGGGRVFATGSITFCGSLPHNHFDNNVSTMLANIVDKMIA